jgi:hypothetical protein
MIVRLPRVVFTGGIRIAPPPAWTRTCTRRGSVPASVAVRNPNSRQLADGFLRANCRQRVKVARVQ